MDSTPPAFTRTKSSARRALGQPGQVEHGNGLRGFQCPSHADPIGHIAWDQMDARRPQFVNVRGGTHQA